MNKNNATDFEARVSELKRGLADAPNQSEERERLRSVALVLFRESGLRMKIFARHIGVTDKTVRNWRDTAEAQATAPRTKSKVRQKMAYRKRKGFKELKVIPGQSTASECGERAFTINLAGGAVVTGLSLEDLAKLMKHSGGGR
jgi:DNA-binding transcriptional regulator YiaG